MCPDFLELARFGVEFASAVVEPSLAAWGLLHPVDADGAEGLLCREVRLQPVLQSQERRRLRLAAGEPLVDDDNGPLFVQGGLGPFFQAFLRQHIRNGIRQRGTIREQKELSVVHGNIGGNRRGWRRRFMNVVNSLAHGDSRVGFIPRFAAPLVPDADIDDSRLNQCGRHRPIRQEAGNSATRSVRKQPGNSQR